MIFCSCLYLIFSRSTGRHESIEQVPEEMPGCRLWGLVKLLRPCFAPRVGTRFIKQVELEQVLFSLSRSPDEILLARVRYPWIPRVSYYEHLSVVSVPIDSRIFPVSALNRAELLNFPLMIRCHDNSAYLSGISRLFVIDRLVAQGQRRNFFFFAVP